MKDILDLTEHALCREVPLAQAAAEEKLVEVRLLNFLCILCVGFRHPEAGREDRTGNRGSKSQSESAKNLPPARDLFMYSCFKVHVHLGG